MLNPVSLALAAILSPQTTTDFTGSFPLLNITALTSTQNGYSTIQCWQLTSSVPEAAMSALNYGIGNTSRATWSIIEPRTLVGEAWAPTVQLTMVLNGLIHVSVPTVAASIDVARGVEAPEGVGSTNRQKAYFQPGTLASSVLIAADLKATSYVSGHWTEFPGNEPTILVQTPFVDNLVPAHKVLHNGPCE